MVVNNKGFGTEVRRRLLEKYSVHLKVMTIDFSARGSHKAQTFIVPPQESIMK